jgi:hypothetical protein
MKFFISKKGEKKMKRTIVSVSLAMLMCLGFMGLQEVGSTSIEEDVAVVEETANVTAPAEATAPAEEEAAPAEEPAPAHN